MCGCQSLGRSKKPTVSNDGVLAIDEYLINLCMWRSHSATAPHAKDNTVCTPSMKLRGCGGAG
jgi:hypothetical protein